jgi:hypothetical protein
MAASTVIGEKANTVLGEKAHIFSMLTLTIHESIGYAEV